MSPDAQPLHADGRWLEQAEKMLAGLGFCLTDADPAHGTDATHLLVAIRAQPTLAHFDPERIEYWATESGRGRRRVLDRENCPPAASEFAWGQIGLADRLAVRNEFLSFGGSLRVETTPDGTIYVDFSSHAPILRWSGHSQSGDAMAGEVGAFLARLKVPIDFVPGTEALIAQAAPSTLYCAFVQYVRDRLTQARTLREANRWLAEWCLKETTRLQASVPEHWKGAGELRKQLSAAEAIARE